MKEQIVIDRYITYKFRKQLERGNPLRSKFRIIVPDLIYKQEFNNETNYYWSELGFDYQIIDPEGIKTAENFINENLRIALSDLLCFVLAKKNNCPLATEDKYLSKLAIQKNIICLNFNNILF